MCGDRRFEIAPGVKERRPRAASCRDIRAAAPSRPPSRSTRVELSVADDLAGPRRQAGRHARRVARANTKIDRLDRHDGVAIEHGRGRARECRPARRPQSRPSPGAPLAKRPLATMPASQSPRSTTVSKPQPPCRKWPSRISRKMSSSSSKRGGVDPERDAAAAPDRLADRRDAARQMQVRARVGRDDRAGTPRSRRVLRRARGRNGRASGAATGGRALQALERRPRDRRCRRRRADSASPADACARAGRLRASARRSRRAARPSTIAGRWGRTGR